MEHEQARKTIKEILETNICFEGHFNKCFDNLKKNQKEELLRWVQDCKDRKANPIQSKKDKRIIGFVKKIGSNLRCILTKEKSCYFIAIFLDKHKYYETEMSRLGF